jgi:hypothetical protein
MFTFHSSKRYFLNDGKPHFFKLDTAWMAFINLTVDEFEEYVKFRVSQGYNGLLMQNTPAFQDMPAETKYFPFRINEDGSYDLSVLNDEYFLQAKRKMEIMQRYNVTAFVAPVWVSFIEDSQMEKVFDCSGKQFKDFNDYKRVVDYTIELYREFHPVWLIGGDAELDEESKTNYEYYSYMASKIRELCPQDLMGAHIGGGTYIDKRYIDKGFIDFYTFQTGHMYNGMRDIMAPVNMSLASYNLTPTLPVINLEPMYEAHGFGNRFGRFDEHYIRRAFWYSVLSGANAGFAYGAHGIWMFYDGKGFNNENWSKIPMNWRNALTLTGSYDVIYCTDIFERYNMFEMQPMQEINLTPYDEIRVAAKEDLSLITAYTPYFTYIDLAVNLSEYDCKWYLLGSNKLIINSEVRITSAKEIEEETNRISKGQKFPVKLSQNLVGASIVSRVEMYQYNCDAVLVCRKK